MEEVWCLDSELEQLGKIVVVDSGIGLRGAEGKLVVATGYTLYSGVEYLE